MKKGTRSSFRGPDVPSYPLRSSGVVQPLPIPDRPDWIVLRNAALVPRTASGEAFKELREQLHNIANGLLGKGTPDALYEAQAVTEIADALESVECSEGHIVEHQRSAAWALAALAWDLSALLPPHLRHVPATLWRRLDGRDVIGDGKGTLMEDFNLGEFDRDFLKENLALRAHNPDDEAFTDEQAQNDEFLQALDRDHPNWYTRDYIRDAQHQDKLLERLEEYLSPYNSQAARAVELLTGCFADYSTPSGWSSSEGRSRRRPDTAPPTSRQLLHVLSVLVGVGRLELQGSGLVWAQGETGPLPLRGYHLLEIAARICGVTSLAATPAPTVTASPEIAEAFKLEAMPNVTVAPPSKLAEELAVEAASLRRDLQTTKQALVEVLGVSSDLDLVDEILPALRKGWVGQAQADALRVELSEYQQREAVLRERLHREVTTAERARKDSEEALARLEDAEMRIAELQRQLKAARPEDLLAQPLPQDPEQRTRLAGLLARFLVSLEGLPEGDVVREACLAPSLTLALRR